MLIPFVTVFGDIWGLSLLPVLSLSCLGHSALTLLLGERGVVGFRESVRSPPIQRFPLVGCSIQAKHPADR